MKAKQKKLAREQLDETLKCFGSLKALVPPAKGWVRAIRDALGMTGQQLASRLNTNKQRMARSNQMMRLEKQELDEAEKQKVLRGLIEDIMNEQPKSLWDER